jgi:hypothetical protein
MTIVHPIFSDTGDEDIPQYVDTYLAGLFFSQASLTLEDPQDIRIAPVKGGLKAQEITRITSYIYISWSLSALLSKKAAVRVP